MANTHTTVEFTFSVELMMTSFTLVARSNFVPVAKLYL